MWTTELRVSQPDPEFPRVFKEEVGSRYTVQIKYVEAACDLITKTPEKAQHLLGSLVEHLMLSRTRRPILKSQNVYYWAGRTAVTNLVAYADRASKVHSPWAGRSCAHMELRIRGTSGLNRFGIYGLENLLHFDHPSAWESATRFAFVPSKTSMGYVLRDGENVADDTALRAAEKHMVECAVEGHRSLHNAVVTTRQLRKTLQMIPHREIFGEER